MWIQLTTTAVLCEWETTNRSENRDSLIPKILFCEGLCWICVEYLILKYKLFNMEFGGSKMDKRVDKHNMSLM